MNQAALKLQARGAGEPMLDAFAQAVGAMKQCRHEHHTPFDPRKPIRQRSWTRCSPSRRGRRRSIERPSRRSSPTCSRAAMRRVLEYTQRFDRVAAADASRDSKLPPRRTASRARRAAADRARGARERPRERIRDYHENAGGSQLAATEADGTVLGQQVTPLDRVGIYVPGGKAAYPSSVLMNAIPAHVAGVARNRHGRAHAGRREQSAGAGGRALAGVDRVFTIGGAQAVGALAYGTATVPAVDKIVGPGNAYVAAAKRRVFGTVGIDMIAGPSRDPGHLRRHHRSGLDRDGPVLAGRARRAGAVHPAVARCRFHRAVAASADRRLLPNMPRQAIIADLAGESRRADPGARPGRSLRDRQPHRAGTPGDLRRRSADAGGQLRHAGAIFLGRYTSESLGDYCAGPNHVLPTSRTARFSSPLGVYDFQKRSSLIEVSPLGAQKLGEIASKLALGEGLHAHAQSALYRKGN